MNREAVGVLNGAVFVLLCAMAAFCFDAGQPVAGAIEAALAVLNLVFFIKAFA